MNTCRYKSKNDICLEGHQGPATSYIKDYGHIETQGRVEKNRPDTDYKLDHLDGLQLLVLKVKNKL